MLHLGGAGKYVSQIRGWSVHLWESGDLQSMLTVVAAAAVCMTVIALSSVSTLMASLFKMLNMFWLAMYPSWPAVVWRDIAVK